MKYVCSNRRFEKNGAPGLETDPPGVPQFPPWVHAKNNGSRHWSQGIQHQIYIHDSAIICTFLVNKWIVFILGDILKLQVVFRAWEEPIQNARKRLRPNNIIHSTADQTEALELVNWKIPLSCQSAKRKCAGSGRQLHPLRAEYWMRNKVIAIECRVEIRVFRCVRI